MGLTVTLTLDDETGQYLEHIAAGQGRTAAEVAAWIVTEDLRRERAIDEELVVRGDALVDELQRSLTDSQLAPAAAARRERVGD